MPVQCPANNITPYEKSLACTFHRSIYTCMIFNLHQDPEKTGQKLDGKARECRLISYKVTQIYVVSNHLGRNYNRAMSSLLKISQTGTARRDHQ